jgi:hypothetical protein
LEASWSTFGADTPGQAFQEKTTVETFIKYLLSAALLGVGYQYTGTSVWFYLADKHSYFDRETPEQACQNERMWHLFFDPSMHLLLTSEISNTLHFSRVSILLMSTAALIIRQPEEFVRRREKTMWHLLLEQANPYMQCCMCHALFIVVHLWFLVCRCRYSRLGSTCCTLVVCVCFY